LNEEHLSMLWMAMVGLYSHLFTSKYGVKDNGSWFETLKDLTPKAINSGLERLRGLEMGLKFAEFPPNALQFRALCLSFYADLKLPTAREAYQEIYEYEQYGCQSFSHPVVHFAACQLLGKDFYGIERDCDRYPLFKKAYEEVCLMARKGHPVPEIKAMPKPYKKASIEVADRHLAKMKQVLKGVSS
jgi:hypothetical protein